MFLARVEVRLLVYVCMILRITDVTDQEGF